MTGQEMLEALENLDPAYIEAAATPPKTKRMHSVKRWIAVAACLVLLLSVGLGTYAYAVEVKEYNAAIRFFGEYDLPTEGLSRGDIKAVYRDISTQTFTHSKTEEVIENSLTPEQRQEFEEFKSDSAVGVKDLWDYKTQESANNSPTDTTVPTVPTQPTPTVKPVEMVKLQALTFEVIPEHPDGYTVTKCEINATGELVIPATINGNPVVAIGKQAFSECKGLTRVTLPDSVHSIDGSAFYRCSKLSQVILSDNLLKVSDSAFKGCYNLNYNKYERSNYLGSAANPYLLLMTGPGQKSQTCIIHPDTKLIYTVAFYGHNNLTQVTIPDGVRFIGYGAFGECSGLTDVTISSSIAIIEGHAFSGCTNLKYNTYDNALYLGSVSNPYQILMGSVGSQITECQIHPDTRIIHSSAFYGHEKLTRITIPDSVVCVGRSAFAFCSSLTEVTWSANCQLIDIATFEYCTALESIVIPEGVTTVLDAFSGCNKLMNISVPSSLVSMDHLFLIEKVPSGRQEPVYNIYGNAKYLGNAENPYLILMKAVSTDITECQIHPETRIIHTKAFAGCKNLTELTIPDKVVSAMYPFNGCSALKKVTIGKSLAVFYVDFRGCDKLEGIWVSKDNLYYTSDEFGVLFNKDLSKLLAAPGMISGHYTVPNSVQVIAGSAFERCENLTGITIGTGLMEIVKGALGDCKNLVDIRVAEGNRYFKINEDGILISMDDKMIYKAPATLGGHYTLPDSVTTIGPYAFYNCSKLESVTYPHKNVGVWFEREFPDGITKIYATD